MKEGVRDEEGERKRSGLLFLHPHIALSVLAGQSHSLFQLECAYPLVKTQITGEMVQGITNYHQWPS